MYNEELMYEDTRGNFVEKEIKRTENAITHVLLVLALLVNIVLLIRTEPVTLGIFIIGTLLGMLSGYKLAFDRISKK